MFFSRRVQDVARDLQDCALGLVRSGRLSEAAVALSRNFLGLNDRPPSLNYNLAQLHKALNRPREALRFVLALRTVDLQCPSRDASGLVGNNLFKSGDF